MSYMKEFEVALIEKLGGAEDTQSLVRWITEKVLESYRNGIKAGRQGVSVIRDGKSRRRDAFGKTE